MRLAAVTPVYNEEALMKGCIKCLEDYVDTHIVLVSERPYYGDTREQDNTAEIAEDLGATVIKGHWPLDHHQRNTGITLLKDYDWIICTDCDMWLTEENMIAISKKIHETKEDAVIVSQWSYWKDTDHAIVDDFMPVIAIRPKVRFSYIGNVDSPVDKLTETKIHHLAWCHPKDIYKKVTTYSHAPEFDGERWYEEHYKNWEESDKATLPNREYQIVKRSLPDELKKYLP